jgi:cytochrome c oxidase subunit 1
VAGCSGGGKTIMATAATVHSHAPQGFIRKYIFSLDHKVIGIQYYFLALTSVFIGMFLSLLMRIHMIWPTVSLPLVGDIKPENYLALVTMHGTIMVFFVLTTAPQERVSALICGLQVSRYSASLR